MIVVHGIVAFMDAYGIGEQRATHSAPQQLQHQPPLFSCGLQQRAARPTSSTTVHRVF
jgi:hypothetical protein